VAAALAGDGAKVAIAARAADEIERAVTDLRVRGTEVFGMAADVGDSAQVHDLVAAVSARFGHLDILVNAAGVPGPIGPLWQAEPRDWCQTININLLGTMLCCKAAIPGMIAAGGGKIINFSGGGATGPRAFFSAYAASKAAVVRMTETLAEEVRPFGIDVNAVAPGMVNTRLLDAIELAGPAAGREPEMLGALRKEPGRFVPAEIPAELVVFLASSASNGLTGRLVSAPHDDWQKWDKSRIKEISKLPWLTLRRMDRHTLQPFLDELVAAKRPPVKP